MSTILIVEDNKTLARAEKAILQKHLNFSVDIAFNYAQAQNLLKKKSYFLALLDLNLPDAPNGEIVDLIAKKIPSIVFTATYDDNVRDRVMSKGVLDYFVKGGIEDFNKVVEEVQRFKTNATKTVLVVEDSSTIRHAIVASLKRFNYHTLEARDGSEALDIVAQNSPVHVVITDYNMPKIDGYELIGHLRRSHGKDEMAIIGLSADDATSVSTRFLKHGANDFLKKPFEEEELRVRVSQNIELLEKIGRIRDIANLDMLTGLYNRHYFFDAGEKLYQSAKRGHITLTAALIDIDNFKHINETYGHEAGDKAIKMVAEILAHRFRGSDIVARFNGEEFCVLSPNMPDDTVRHNFDEVRKTIEEHSVVTSNGESFLCTVSIGVSIILGKDLDDMVGIADDMLFRAKEQGKNRVEVY
ncbi:MAG: hypothetical protein KU37_03165 [Sulfuricurvum sp. PC08-66]|nr:MAG: hypothetical protein KU37_03165 [Sulfuricurvum sp. PC08-66]